VAPPHAPPRGAAPHDRLIVSIRAEHPMRISVQLRTGGEGQPQRWQRSIYGDSVQQEHTIYFDDMMPVGRTETFKPDLPNVRSLLFVIDATNTKPGDSGRIWIRQAALAH